MGATKKRPAKKTAKRATKKKAATPQPEIGRPTKLDAVVVPASDDRPAATTADIIVNAIRSGTPVDVAAAYAGVNKSTLIDWLNTGARVLALVASGAKSADFTRRERLAADFSDRAIRAQAEFEVAALQAWDRVAMGGQTSRVITAKTERVVEPHPDATKDNPLPPEVSYVEVERTVRTETLLPDWKALEARLRYRHPERYALTRLEDAEPPEREAALTEDQLAESALQSLRTFRKAIDAKSTEVTADDPGPTE